MAGDGEKVPVTTLAVGEAVGEMMGGVVTICEVEEVGNKDVVLETVGVGVDSNTGGIVVGKGLGLRVGRFPAPTGGKDTGEERMGAPVPLVALGMRVGTFPPTTGGSDTGEEKMGAPVAPVALGIGVGTFPPPTGDKDTGEYRIGAPVPLVGLYVGVVDSITSGEEVIGAGVILSEGAMEGAIVIFVKVGG